MELEEAEHAAFEEKVQRTVYIDNLSPRVTEPVVRTALNQFGNVKKVEFIPNFTESSRSASCALVEMENPMQAKQIVTEMLGLPFMMAGMPRPIRVCAAEMEMFEYRPKKPGRKISCQWLDPHDPDFQIAEKMKILVQKHAAEASFVLEKELEEEEKLAKQQEETLMVNYQKLEAINRVLGDGTATRLARWYDMRRFNPGFNKAQ